MRNSSLSQINKAFSNNPASLIRLSKLVANLVFPVPVESESKARLRITLSALHEFEDVTRLLEALDDRCQANCRFLN